MTRAFYRTFAGALLLTATLVLLGTAAHAQFNFSAPTGTIGSGGRTTFTIHPGDTLTFYGTLTNNYGDELDDVSILPTFAGSAASNFTFVYPRHLILGYPYTFNIHDTNSNNTLTITAKATAAPGTYVFYFDAYAAGDDNGFYTGDIYSDTYNIVVVSGSTVPGPPTNLGATAGTKQITLNWTAPAGVTGATYSLYRGTTNGGESTTALATGITATTYTDTTTDPFTSYYYIAKTVTSGGTSVASNEAFGAANPAPPTNLKAQAGNQSVSLTWDPTPSPITVTYDVYRGTTAGGEGVTPIATNLTTAAYTDTGLTNGTAYYYTVRESGNYPTGNSNEATATPIAPPAAPTNLQTVAGNTQVTLTWTAPAGPVTSYTLYRGTSAATLTALKAGITATTFTNAFLTNGTTYYYAVAAVNSAGTGPKSSTVAATPTGAALPAAPTNLTAVAGNTQVTLSWTAPTGTVTSYTLYRGTSASSLTALKSGITTTTFTNVSLKNGTTYYYAVAAVNSAGTGPKSSTVSATPLALPAAPTNLQVVVGNLQATLSWTAPAGTVTSYTLYRGTSASSLTVLKTGITTTSFTNVALKHGTTYYYTVSAVNASGTGPASNEVSATP